MTTEPGGGDVLATALRRVAAVQSGDIEAVMAALVDEPVFDLLPMGLRLAGSELIRRYYRRFLGEVMPRTSGTHVGTYVGAAEVAFEFVTSYTDDSGAVETFRILAVQPVVGDRVAGERLYCSEGYARLIVGEELWPLLTPTPPP